MIQFTFETDYLVGKKGLAGIVTRRWREQLLNSEFILEREPRRLKVWM